MHEPKYPTLKALVKAVQSGELDPSTFTLIVDNDSIYAWTNDEDDATCLFRSDECQTDLLIDHFRSLGLPAQSA